MGDGFGAPGRESSSYIVDERAHGPSGVTNSPIICSLPSFRFPTPIFDDPLIWPPVYCSWSFADWLRHCHSLFFCLQFCEATHCSLFLPLFSLLSFRVYGVDPHSHARTCCQVDRFFSHLVCFYLLAFVIVSLWLYTHHRCRLHAPVSVVSVI